MRRILRNLWNITLSSVLTLVVYVALYAVWGAILSELKSMTIRLLLIAAMTTAAFGVILLFFSKIRRSVGEDEVIADYKDRDYSTVVNDLKLVLRREAGMLTLMTALVLGCYLLNRMDVFLFGQKTFSRITVLYAPMSLFGTVFRAQIIGYFLSAILNSAAYLLVLLLFRKRKYIYWMNDQG